MTVAALLRVKPSRVITVHESVTVAEAARLLMEERVGGLPVVDAAGAPVGFVAEREIVGAVLRHPQGAGTQPLSGIMRRPAPTCSAQVSIPEAMRRMTRDRLRHLVVVDGSSILGVVSVGDMVRHRLEQLETETGVLRDYVAGQRARGP
jgi:CBS domain-containing protein